MQGRVRVYVVSQSDRKRLTCEWKDPVSGRIRRQSSGTTKRREAERVASQIEQELNSGGRVGNRTSWKAFRVEYEKARTPKWSPETLRRVRIVFDKFERIIGPRFLDSIDSRTVTEFDSKMDKEGNAPATRGIALALLRAALYWAHRRAMIARMPIFEFPDGSKERGGRAIELREHQQISAQVPVALGKVCGATEADVAKCQHFLETLWVSGLRISEAHALSWDEGAPLWLDVSGQYPTFVIAAEFSKNRKQQRFPCSPEAWEHFSKTPPEHRHGPVSGPTLRGRRMKALASSYFVARLGKLAGVVVGTTFDGKAVYASAHDYRRAFATRWAAKVLPAVLAAMMRHASLATTMKFYTSSGADPISQAIWETLGASAKTPTSDPGAKTPEGTSDGGESA